MGRRRRRSRGDDNWLCMGRLGDWWDVRKERRGGRPNGSRAGIVPLCVAKAEQQPDQLTLLKKESSYSRKEFVVKAGWVSNVAEKYRRNVANRVHQR